MLKFLDLKSNKKKLFIFSLTFILGLVLVAQFYAQREAQKVKSEENSSALAAGISIVAQENSKLEEEISLLQTKFEEYQEILAGKNPNAIQESLVTYKKISGLVPVLSEGVEVQIKGSIKAEQLLDIINTLKSAGSKALSINNNRLVFSSYIIQNDKEIKIDGKSIYFPYVILAVGEPDVLAESLTRKAGIAEKIMQNFEGVKITVKENNNLELDSFEGNLDFKYAQKIK